MPYDKSLTYNCLSHYPVVVAWLNNTGGNLVLFLAIFMFCCCCFWPAHKSIQHILGECCNVMKFCVQRQAVKFLSEISRNHCCVTRGMCGNCCKNGVELRCCTFAVILSYCYFCLFTLHCKGKASVEILPFSLI